ncbi:MAG: Multidrug resistance efflux pump [Rhodoglobus sp.]|nr:Multidrug resistance efflux pump [Rhodoglobus sp.]
MRTLRLDELTDSRILYEKRPPVFGFFVISLALVALATAGVWAAVTTKPSIVQAAGDVESENRTYVMSTVSGRILEVAAPNGSTVKKDDPMIVVESGDLAIEKKAVDDQLAALNKQLALHARYSADLENDLNDFDPANPEESYFYYQLESLANQQAQLRVDPPSLAALGYTAVEIDNAIAGNRVKAAGVLNAAQSAAAEQAATLRRQIDELTIHGSALESQVLGYTVSAAASGEVYLDPHLKPGTVVTVGQTLGTIAAADAGLAVRVYLAVPDREFVGVGDPVRVTVSGLPAAVYDKIDGTIASIDSDVTVLDSGGSTGTQSVFGISVDLDRYYLVDRDGKHHDLGNGTAVRVDLVYDEETYLQYLLGLLGFSAGGADA